MDLFLLLLHAAAAAWRDAHSAGLPAGEQLLEGRHLALRLWIRARYAAVEIRAQLWGQRQQQEQAAAVLGRRMARRGSLGCRQAAR